MKRHRPPTLVSMWMLDVFCCALGCVTLLWLLKTREAGFALSEARTVTERLDDQKVTNLRLMQTIDDQAKRIALVQKERDDKAKELALVQELLDETAKKLALTDDDLADAKKRVAAQESSINDLRKRASMTDEELLRKKNELEMLTKKATDTAKSSEELQRLLRKREEEAAMISKRVKELDDQLSTARSNMNDMSKAQARIRELEKELGNANTQIIDLQGTKAKLADKIDKLTVEIENKFAGVALTGKRVVFLIDMSGSMDLLDEYTKADTKWATVAETVFKVMKSLPDLQQYQVILFSNRLQYLQGREGAWIDFDRSGSPDSVRKAMLEVKPAGDTNMYSAMQEAFKFRSRGLDTLYLFSDGLPTVGPNPLNKDKTQVLSKEVRDTLKQDWNSVGKGTVVRINSIGFFYESPDVGAFLWALSRENNGSFVGMSRP